ncbi:MAG: xanthine phosphoribosyltransferase [Endozoicomonadaceae bacterium]|nr:xanthine phosphoribosyltransferase [Endozoicomonadaceae bacterium]MCY4330717.1 xanthine phosphoribosyltransferase [Endozoicomonadaceae bacterium]
MSDKTTPQEVVIPWEILKQDAQSLAEKLKGKSWKGLVAVTRGGMTPAALLGYYLNITNIETLCLSSYSGRTQSDITIVKNANIADQGKDWLIVDDLADTGQTLRVIKNILPEAYIATLYAKPAGKSLPDVYVKDFQQSTWIVFPWEC